MNGKTYRGESFSELLERATTELGPEAVVLSSRRVPGSDHHEIVVTVPDADAAVDIPPIEESAKKKLVGAPPLMARPQLSVEAQPAQERPLVKAAAPTPSMPVFEALAGRGATDPVAQRLMSSGIQPELARRLVAEARADGDGSELAVRRRVAQLLGQGRDDGTESKVLVLAGAPGVGKTTLAAKLAAYHRFQFDARPALVTLDTHRVGAVDQLRTLAELMGIPFAVAGNGAELEAILQVHARSRPVLVDTPGLILSKDADFESLQSWLSCMPERSLLYVSTTSVARDVLAENLARLAPLSLGALAFTRLDERDDVGLMVSACAQAGRPVRYLSDGPGVPGNFRIPMPADLARRVVPLKTDSAIPRDALLTHRVELAYGEGA